MFLDPTVARRDFFRIAGSCAAHLAWVTAGLGGGASRLFAASDRRHVVQEEPWGRLEELADGVWALISTPLEDQTTLCNGGIVAGRDLVAVVEAFASPAGATWMAERARALTGRWPDLVVLTHYHGDHTAGVEGFADPGGAAGPAIHSTAETRDRTDRAALSGATLLPAEGTTTLDLGGRVLTLESRSGHTASDVTVILEDPSIVFCGDLVWNGMFPNYVDARPTELTRSVAALVRDDPSTVYVPGHGTLARTADLERYRALLDEVEVAARDARDRGLDAAEAAAAFSLPAELGEWFRFSETYPERAIGAWLAELGNPTP